MKEVYIVCHGIGNDASNGVYIEHEFIDTVYSSREAAMEHARKWLENWKRNAQADSSWKCMEDQEEFEIIESNVLVRYGYCRNDGIYEEHYCTVAKYDVIDEIKDES